MVCVVTRVADLRVNNAIGTTTTSCEKMYEFVFSMIRYNEEKKLVKLLSIILNCAKSAY